MVFFATYQIYNSVEDETQFSAIATGIFILPFFLLSALAGQIADSYDKARIMRIIKAAEVLIMLVGAAGIFLKSIEMMLVALVGMGIHSTFFGPIKYAVLPQHLRGDEVLGGTGMVEAGTYVAILFGTIAGGLISPNVAAFAVVGVAVVGWFAARQIPPPRRSRSSSSISTSSAPRTTSSTARCTSGGCSWRSCRSACSGRSRRSWACSFRRW